MFVIAESTLGAKVIFETIGATAGLAKESLGLAEKLRDRKKEQGILLRRLSQSKDATPEAKDAIRELYDALATATPYVRRIVKKRIMVRLQAVLIWACGAAAVIGLALTIRQLPYLGEMFYSAAQWVLWPLGFVLLYFGAVWMMQFDELKTSAAAIDEFKALRAEWFFSTLPAEVRARAEGLASTMAAREKMAISGLEKRLLSEYGELSSLVDVLEMSALGDSCAEGSLSVGAYLRDSTDKSIIGVLKDAVTNGDVIPDDEHLHTLYDRDGIGSMLKSTRYERAIYVAAAAYRRKEDGEKAFNEELSKAYPDLFSTTLVESQRRSIFSQLGIFTSRFSKH